MHLVTGPMHAYTLSRVLLALGKFGDSSFQVFSVFHFGDFA